jgi:hypothetical protein
MLRTLPLKVQKLQARFFFTTDSLTVLYNAPLSFLLLPLWNIGHLRNVLFHFSFLFLRQSAGLLGWGISLSQGSYLHRTTQTHNKRRQTSMPWVGFELKLVPTLANRGCRVVSPTKSPTAVNFGFLDRSCYFSSQVATQLSSRGWVDPVPDPLLLRKSGSAWNRTRDLWICSQEFCPLDHRGGRQYNLYSPLNITEMTNARDHMRDIDLEER